MSNIIEINNLTKYYGKQKGIENLSFAVEEGEIFGFIGPNGAGKSTTIRTLLALMRPTSGSATIFGRDCIKEAAVIARDVGYLPSETFYYEDMRVKDLLSYSAALYQKDCDRRIHELTELLNLDVNRKIRDLSLGNKKKVGIVQGLLHSPKLIILDEPTSGLDPLMQQVFFDILREENKKGATILFSSHILSEVQKMCSRVAILKQGGLIGIQNVQELREDSYKKVAIQVKGAVSEDYGKQKGIINYEHTDAGVRFMYKGNMNRLLEMIAGLQVSDVTIEEPTLEEIFLHYYE